MSRISLWLGVLGSVVGLLMSFRLFISGLRNLLGGFDFGFETMFWTALLGALYLCVLLGCVLLLTSSRFRRTRSVRWTRLLGICFFVTALGAVALCLPLVLPLALNDAEVVLHFASPMAGVPIVLAAAVVELLVGTLVAKEGTRPQN